MILGPNDPRALRRHPTKPNVMVDGAGNEHDVVRGTGIRDFDKYLEQMIPRNGFPPAVGTTYKMHSPDPVNPVVAVMIVEEVNPHRGEAFCRVTEHASAPEFVGQRVRVPSRAWRHMEEV